MRMFRSEEMSNLTAAADLAEFDRVGNALEQAHLHLPEGKTVQAYAEELRARRVSIEASMCASAGGTTAQCRLNPLASPEARAERDRLVALGFAEAQRLSPEYDRFKKLFQDLTFIFAMIRPESPIEVNRHALTEIQSEQARAEFKARNGFEFDVNSIEHRIDALRHYFTGADIYELSNFAHSFDGERDETFDAAEFARRGLLGAAVEMPRQLVQEFARSLNNRELERILEQQMTPDAAPVHLGEILRDIGLGGRLPSELSGLHFDIGMRDTFAQAYLSRNGLTPPPPGSKPEEIAKYEAQVTELLRSRLLPASRFYKGGEISEALRSTLMELPVFAKIFMNRSEEHTSELQSQR